jgi:tetratricopeptide (TPR) repeat protein
VTRARAEDRLEEAMEGCRKLLELDRDDEAARRAMSEIESVLIDREVDALVGMALTYAADGEFDLATGIAEKVERLAPWSPRYLRLQVYLDEEGARRKADALVATAREHLAAGRAPEAREAVREALATMPSHGLAAKLFDQLPETAPPGPVAPPAVPAAPLPEPTPAPAPDPAAIPPSEAEPASPPEPEKTPSPAVPPVSRPVPAPAPDARIAEAVTLSAAALRHFLLDDHDKARKTVLRALELDPTNRRALELEKILRVLG